MTTDAFTAAARESAASKYQGDWDAYEQEPVDDFGFSECVRAAHVEGWKAARTHLAAQEPTDAEVEALCRAVDEQAGYWLGPITASMVLQETRRAAREARP